MHGRVVGHAAHLLRHPRLRLLARHALGNLEEHVAARAAHRAVHHVDAQRALTPLQALSIQLREVLAAVQVDHRFARIHGLAVASLVALCEVGMRRVEMAARLLHALQLPVVVSAQLAAAAQLQRISQLGTDAARALAVGRLIEALGRGFHGLRVLDVLS